MEKDYDKIAQEIVEVLHKHGIKDKEGLEESNEWLRVNDRVWELWTQE